MEPPSYSVFEYLYRDAANYKTFGKLLLLGGASSEALERIRSKLERGDLFIAEQVGLPALPQQLWGECGVGFDRDLDHPWHEFIALRPAGPKEVAESDVFGSVADLIEEFARVDRWHEIKGPCTSRRIR